MSVEKRSTGQISPAQKEAIGEVIIEWSHLEWTVHVAFAGLLKMEEVAGRMSAAKIRNVETLLSIIESAADLDAKLLSRFAEHRMKILELQDERDWIAHAMWFGLDGSETLTGYLDVRVGLNERRKRTTSQLKRLAQRINTWNGSLISLCERAGVPEERFTLRFSLPGKPPLRGRPKIHSADPRSKKQNGPRRSSRP